MGKHIDTLKTFCAEGNIRPALTEPFIIWEHIYATDSFTMCRILKSEFSTEELQEIENNRAKLWMYEKSFPSNAAEFYMRKKNAVLKHDTFINYPINLGLLQAEQEEVGQVECEECEGSGTKTCWHCDNETDCRDCHGTGYVRTGTGKMITVLKKRVSVHGININGNYFKRVTEAFPEAAIVNVEIVVWELKPVLFSRDQTEIIIMPLSFLEDNMEAVPFQDVFN